MLYRQFFVVTVAVAAFGVLLSQVIESTHREANTYSVNFQNSQLVSVSKLS